MFGKMKSGTADFVMATGKKAGNLPKKAMPKKPMAPPKKGKRD